MKKFEEESLIEDAKSLKVLYIEADKDSRLKLSNFLNKYFKEVASTPYADNAVKLFKSGFFDLVVTDINLPDIDAATICSKIKRIAPRKPIIIVSKKDDLNKLIKLVNIGINGYIKCPLDLSEAVPILAKTVNEIVDLKMMYSYQDSLETNQENIHKKTKKTDKATDLLLTKREKVISAKEFFEKYPIELSNSINNILEINENLDMHINSFIINPSEQNIDLLADEFEKFSLTLENIEEFSDMAFVTNKLAITIRMIEPNKDYKEYSDTFLALSASLNEWFEDIFINKSAKNIHFLDHSMLADALTLEGLFRHGDSSQEDGIEFF